MEQKRNIRAEKTAKFLRYGLRDDKPSRTIQTEHSENQMDKVVKGRNTEGTGICIDYDIMTIKAKTEYFTVDRLVQFLTILHEKIILKIFSSLTINN